MTSREDVVHKVAVIVGAVPALIIAMRVTNEEDLSPIEWEKSLMLIEEVKQSLVKFGKFMRDAGYKQ